MAGWANVRDNDYNLIDVIYEGEEVHVLYTEDERTWISYQGGQIDSVLTERICFGFAEEDNFISGDYHKVNDVF